MCNFQRHKDGTEFSSVLLYALPSCVLPILVAVGTRSLPGLSTQVELIMYYVMH